MAENSKEEIMDADDISNHMTDEDWGFASGENSNSHNNDEESLVSDASYDDTGNDIYDEDENIDDMSVVPFDDDDDAEIDDSKIIKENTKAVSDAQKHFIKFMPVVKCFEKARVGGFILPEDAESREQLIYGLWGDIVFYARGLITAKMETYRKPIDYRNYLEQECFTIFLEHLMDYDPRRAAPTTYFKPYFLQVISEYKHSNSQHMTANEAKNVAKIRHAIQMHEKKGENFDYKTLSIETELSERVVKRTIARMNTSIQANVEDEVIVSSALDTQPEASYIRKEAEQLILDALDETLTEQEKRFYFDRVYNDGNDNRTMPFKLLAEKYDIQPHEAKAMWSSIVDRLYANPVLRRIIPKIKADGLEIVIHTDATKAMENEIIGAMVSDGDTIPDLELTIADSEEMDARTLKALTKVFSESEINYFYRNIICDGYRPIVSVNEYMINYISVLSKKVTRDFGTTAIVLNELSKYPGYIKDPDNLTDYIRHYSTKPKKVIYESDIIANVVITIIQEKLYSDVTDALRNTLSDDDLDFVYAKADSETGTLEEVAEYYGFSSEEASVLWSKIKLKLTSNPLLRKMFVSF